MNTIFQESSTLNTKYEILFGEKYEISEFCDEKILNFLLNLKQYFSETNSFDEHIYINNVYQCLSQYPELLNTYIDIFNSGKFSNDLFHGITTFVQECYEEHTSLFPDIIKDLCQISCHLKSKEKSDYPELGILYENAFVGIKNQILKNKNISWDDFKDLILGFKPNKKPSSHSIFSGEKQWIGTFLEGNPEKIKDLQNYLSGYKLGKNSTLLQFIGSCSDLIASKSQTLEKVIEDGKKIESIKHIEGSFYTEQEIISSFPNNYDDIVSILTTQKYFKTKKSIGVKLFRFILENRILIDSKNTNFRGFFDELYNIYEKSSKNSILSQTLLDSRGSLWEYILTETPQLWPKIAYDYIELLGECDVSDRTGYTIHETTKILNSYLSQNPNSYNTVINFLKKHSKRGEEIFLFSFYIADALSQKSEEDWFKKLQEEVENNKPKTLNSQEIIKKLLPFVYSYPNLYQHLNSYVKSIGSSKNDMQIFYQCSTTYWHEKNYQILLGHLLQNSKKQIIPVCKELLLINDIPELKDIKNIFKSINSPRLIEAITNNRHGIRKVLDISLDTKIERKIKKGLEISTKQSLKNIDTLIGTELVNTLRETIRKEIKLRASEILGIDSKLIKKQCESEDFLEVLKMYGSTQDSDCWSSVGKSDKNKAVFHEILLNHINNNPLFPFNKKENIDWLEKTGIPSDTLNKKYPVSYDIDLSDTSGKEKQIQNFLKVANLKIKALAPYIENTELKTHKKPEELLSYFESTVIKLYANLPEEALPIFEDLKLQVKSITDLQKSKNRHEVTSITIKQQLDPLEICLMGNKVNGSCLSYYSSTNNFYSAGTNAIEVNKLVFYIYDQNGIFIGRVLAAIDNKKKLLRFPVYTSKNLGIDLDPYINSYIKNFTQQCGLGINGSLKKVELLIGDDWYKDPVTYINESSIKKWFRKITEKYIS